MESDVGITSKELEDVHYSVKRLLDVFDSPSTGNNVGNSHINIRAEGPGIWVCVTACLIMMVISLGIGFLYLDQSRKLDRLQDTETVILQYAPQMLRDKVNTLEKK